MSNIRVRGSHFLPEFLLQSANRSRGCLEICGPFLSSLRQRQVEYTGKRCLEDFLNYLIIFLGIETTGWIKLFKSVEGSRESKFEDL